MTPSFKNLEKILQQEQKLGYQNKAVIGGIDRFVKNWVPRALQEATDKSQRLLIEKIAIDLKHYGQSESVTEREKILANLLERFPMQMKGESGPSDSRHSRSSSEGLNPIPSSSWSSTPRSSSSRPKASLQDQPKSSRRPSPPPSAQSFGNAPEGGLNAPVTRLSGISAAYAHKLQNLGVTTVDDLLTLYPNRYDDYRSLKTINQLAYGEDVTIMAQIWQVKQKKTRNGRPIVTALLSDGTGTIEASWFNQPWLAEKLTQGRQIILSGRVNQYLGHLNFQSPDWEELDQDQINTGRLVPIYPLTSGITANWLRRLQKRTVDYWSPRLTDHLPAEICERLGLLSLNEAIRQAHFPDDWESLEVARKRLAFDELLMIQLSVFKQRQVWQQEAGGRTSPSEGLVRAVEIDQAMLDSFIQALPFNLTQAQKEVLDEILADMAQAVPMSRLLQGDVGSGKTVVALAAMLATTKEGGQGVILAPTEILAEQHYKNIQSLLTMTGFDERVQISLLTGSTKAKERAAVLDDLASGRSQLLVGTHAIIQDDVIFHKLQLAVVDEQHRFGVNQRSLLRQKGRNPHMLVMSATPIPRSLALTLYGDLDLSIIDQLPPGREVVKTRWLAPKERERAYSFLDAQIEQGRQAFIICPLVEESDKIEARSAIEEHKRLQKTIFPNLALGLLHGRMTGKEKETVMATFRDQKTHILVSTAVVEVGIDIPNASVILIEGANRFGLAQLHQFRGRVGRGSHQSYCLLLADNASEEAHKRLEIMERTNNGFELAEEDLKLRGPGEFFGTKQSGLPSLKMVKLSDTKLLELARAEAKRVFDEDPDLNTPTYQPLAKAVAALWDQASDVN